MNISKITWIPGAMDELRALKRKYIFSKQRAHATTFEFTAIQNNAGQMLCMLCGHEMLSTPNKELVCSLCGSKLVGHTLTTHTYDHSEFEMTPYGA